MKASPAKGIIMGGNQINQSGVDSSRVNDSNQKINENEVSKIGGPSGGNEISKIIP
jgi:hypothetical protein